MKNLSVITLGFLFFAGNQICGCGNNCSTAKAQNSVVVDHFVGEIKTITLKIAGITCAGCSNTLHKALSEKKGILENEVKYPGDVAIIKYDPDKIFVKEIIATIEKAGYKAELMKETEKTGSKEKKCEADCIKPCCVKPKSN